VKRSTLLALMGIMMMMVAAACGGAANTSTTPIATFTLIPTYVFVGPTDAPAVATAAATLSSQTSALDPQAVERGKGRYEALECATCHGAAGEGTDDGASLITSTLNETDFISFMRSGGSIGPDHQYSTNRLSETGGKNLYQYLLSLRNS